MSSILKVDTIEERTSGGGVSFTGTLSPDGLTIPSYSTSGRNALSASTGDVVYNTDINKIEFYNGSSWSSIDTDTTGTSLGLTIALS